MFRIFGRACFSRQCHQQNRWRKPTENQLLYRYTNTQATPRNASGNNPGSSNSKAAGIAAAVGLSAGTFGSLAGVGGSLVVIPALARFAAIPQREAAGCSLFAVSFISTTSAFSYASAGAVDWPTAATLAISAAIASPAGALLSARMNKETLQRILAWFVLCVAPMMPLRSYIKVNRVENEAEVKKLIPSTPKTGLFVGVGAAIGLSSGILGIGGGGLFTAAIAAFSDLPLKVVLGTSLTAMVAPSVAAAFTYARLGHVRLGVVPPLVIGSISGAALGSRLALNAPEQMLQLGFGIVLGLIGIRMLRRPLTSKIRSR